MRPLARLVAAALLLPAFAGCGNSPAFAADAFGDAPSDAALLRVEGRLADGAGRPIKPDLAWAVVERRMSRDDAGILASLTAPEADGRFDYRFDDALDVTVTFRKSGYRDLVTRFVGNPKERAADGHWRA